jgi:hypothetical protein
VESNPLKPPEHEELVFALAFAIEDPCSAEVVRFASHMIAFALAIPENRRHEACEALQKLAGTYV